MIFRNCTNGCWRTGAPIHEPAPGPAARATALLLFLALAPPVLAQQPPIIDRELLFGSPEISGAQLSPDGKRIAFVRPWNGIPNIWVKKAAEPLEKAKLVSADSRKPVPEFAWSRDGRYILFAQDRAGDDNRNIYAVDPSEAPPPGAVAPPARNLTQAYGVRAVLYAVPRSEPDVLYAGLNSRERAWLDLYRIRISTGERTLLWQNRDRITRWVFDNRDRLRLAVRMTSAGDTEILRVDPEGLKKIYGCTVFESCSPEVFGPDDRSVYITTNRGDEKDLIELALLDPATGKAEAVESDPMKRADFGGILFSELTHEILATAYVDEKLRIYWKDRSYQADYRLLEKKLPGKQIHFHSHSEDERLWLLTASSDTEPGETYLFDRKTHRLKFQFRVLDKLNRNHLAPMQPVRYKSSDGLEIPAYLTLPKGLTPKSLPLVLCPHDGPWARDTWGFHPGAQFLANRGYAVLQPNFRGSTGYGKKFLDAGDRQWGEKMQEDLTWGARHLIEQGVADPKRIGIMGGSYGGYAALAGAAFTPKLYAAAVALGAPSNLITLLESIPPSWEAGRRIYSKRVGDPHTADGKAKLERQSPINAAAEIQAPLLVACRASDPGVDCGESGRIVAALRDRRLPVEYLASADEATAVQAAVERFLANHLRGRFQAGGTPEAIAPGAGAPQLAAGLSAGVYRYKATLGGRAEPIERETVIEETAGAWTVTESLPLPAGELRDTAKLDKNSLILLARVIRQGPWTADLAFQNNRVTGKISLNGQTKPFAAESDGPLFADGAGRAFAVGALPLAEGYSVLVRNFDVPSGQFRRMQVKVTGSEGVTVPAGSFECYRVEIAPAEGGGERETVWIAKNSRKPVRTISVSAILGGAALTSELR